MSSARSKTWWIARRELRAYFLSPLAYVVTAVFLLINGYIFAAMLLTSRYADLRLVLANMAVTLIFIVPVLTMRVLAEERRQGTDELLLTSPLTVAQIVIGKYLAALVLYALILALTGVYPLILWKYGHPEFMPMLTGYLGVFLLGAAFLAAGVFASSLSDSQVVAGAVGFGLLLTLWIIDWAAGGLQGTAAKILQQLSVLRHLGDFQKGVIDSGHVLFYLSLGFVFLFLAVRMVEKRRWS